MATRWALFAGATLIVLLVVLGLSRATARELTESDGPAPGDEGESTPKDGEPPQEDTASRAETNRSESPGARRRRAPRASEPNLILSAGLSQALVGTLLSGFAWYAEIPLSALGIDDPAAAMLPGIAVGVGLYVANEAGAWLAVQAEIDADEALRELLAPETTGEWALLLLVVLPLVAGVEELLFRGALIGAFAAGFSLSPWLLAVFSSVAFGLGHGLQGPGGILVTGVLGFALAAVFIVTGSLWVVILAHYLVNALEFLVHEGVGVDWGDP
ncbi:MAG: lysostaphin resistance A-like protein [Halobacteriales archaeon]